MANTYDKASLVLIPSGTKEGVCFSQKPTNGDGDFTFSRSTSATRVGPSGYIEKETQNLLLYSNDFSQTDWVQGGTTRTGGQAGYDGSNDAWELVRSSGGSLILNQSQSLSGVYTFSCYIKINATNGIGIGFSSSNYALFNISDALQTSAVFETGAVSSTINYVGNNFYRISITANGSFSEVRFLNATSDGTSASSGGGTHIVQDAQLEQGLVARDYIETTTSAVYGGITDNIPRLDYNGSCPSLLLEPQRTNLALYSEQFDNAAWEFGGLTKTANNAISPEGVQNAYKIEITTLVTPNLRQTILVTAGLSYTFSFYAKSDDLSELKLAVYDLNNASFILENQIKAITSTWSRVSLTFTTPAGCSSIRTFIFRNSDSLGSFWLYGAQLEEGSYATSYIPTYGTSVTFANDSCSKTGVSDLIGQTEGTLFVETNKEMDATLERIFSIYSTTSPTFDNITISKTTINTISVSVRKNNVLNTYAPSFTGTIRKLAIAYSTASNGLALYVNGTQLFLNTDSGNFSTTLSEVYIGSLRPSISTSDLYNDGINQTLLFKTRLSNEELEALTQV